MKFPVLLLLIVVANAFHGCARPVELTLLQQVDRLRVQEQALKRATLLLQAGTAAALGQATELFRYAHQLQPRDPRPLDGLGSIAFRDGRMLDAEEFFRKAIELDPTYSSALVHLALLAERRGEIDKAEQLLREVLDSNPTSVSAMNNLAALLLDQGNDLLEVEQLLTRAEVSTRYPSAQLAANRMLYKQLRLQQSDRASRGREPPDAAELP